MTGVVTITAKSGPGVTATALELTGVTAVNFDLHGGMIFIFSEGQPDPKQFSLDGVTTVTVSISGSTYTFTVS